MHALALATQVNTLQVPSASAEQALDIMSAMQHAKNISTLILSHINFSTWSVDQIQNFMRSLQKSPHINTIYFESCHYPLEALPSFCEGLAKAKGITKIDFGDCTMPFLEALSNALSASSKYAKNKAIHVHGINGEVGVEDIRKAVEYLTFDTVLDLSRTSLHDWATLQMKALTTAIQDCSHIHTVSFAHCHNLWTWTPDQIAEFMQGIQPARHVSVLDLSKVEMQHWDEDRVKAFTQGLQQADNIQELRISKNNLSTWELPKLRILLDGIKQATHIHTIILSLELTEAIAIENIQQLMLTLSEISPDRHVQINLPLGVEKEMLKVYADELPKAACVKTLELDPTYHCNYAGHFLLIAKSLAAKAPYYRRSRHAGRLGNGNPCYTPATRFIFT